MSRRRCKCTAQVFSSVPHTSSTIIRTLQLQEITIDGFKSYAQRVHIPAFDPQFNAITGLNGSGKSEQEGLRRGGAAHC